MEIPLLIALGHITALDHGVSPGILSARFIVNAFPLKS
jgi:hypothetical protein